MGDIIVERSAEGPDPNILKKQLSVYLLDIIEFHDKNELIAIDDSLGKELWTDQLVQDSLLLAGRLQFIGCKPGCVIGIICENRYDFFVLSLAVFRIGAILTAFNPLAKKDELQHFFGISKPYVIFSASSCLKVIEELLSEFSFMEYVIDVDSVSSVNNNDRVLSLDYFLSSSNHEYTNVYRKPDDTALILYSSGTTGFSKGVALSNKNIITVLELTRLGYIPTVVGDYTVSTIPLFSSYGILVNLLSVVIQFKLVIMKQFSEEFFFSSIEKYKVKFLYLVPRAMFYFLNSPLVDSYDLSSLEAVVCGGASLNQQIADHVKRRLNLKTVYDGYGLTETSMSAIQCKPHSFNKPGSCGFLLPTMKCKVVDIKSGKSLGPTEIGELYFSGPNVMIGYYGNEEETKMVLDSDGWFHSGDLGYYDEDNFFFIVDRVKDVIKYQSYQVIPAELENLLLKHDQIKDAAVIGIPDEVNGELPKAYIVKKPEATITEVDVIQYISERVSSQKELRGGVEFIDQIPRNPGGKIWKRVLKMQSIAK